MLDDQPTIVAGLHLRHIAGLLAQLHQGADLILQVPGLAAGMLILLEVCGLHAADQLIDAFGTKHLLDRFDQLQGEHTVGVGEASLRSLGEYPLL
ncbi:hypothetical protein D3C80_1963310 [compost metagenome]